MKTRILVSGSTLALALAAALPAWAGLRVEAAPSSPSPVTSPSAPVSRAPSNYQELGSPTRPAALDTSKLDTSNPESSTSSIKAPPVAPVLVQARDLEVIPATDRHSSTAIHRWSSPSAPAAFPSYVTQSGTPDASASRTVPAGSDVLLSDALSQILPSGFTLVDNQIGLRKLASWTGSRSWLDVLADLGRAANFVAHVDWSARQVSLAPAPTALAQKETTQSPAAHSPAVKEVREIREVQLVSTPKPVVVEQRVQPAVALPPPVSSWTLDPALTLQENVKSWAQKAGWTVVWDAVDYPVFAKTSFQGEFSASTGPLAQVFAGYTESDQPLLVRLTSKDRVVYVRNRILDRAEVSPLPEPIPDGTF